MSKALKNQVSALGSRYVAGWADTQNRLRGGGSGATDPTLIFLEGQVDGQSNTTVPLGDDGAEKYQHIPENQKLERLIVGRFRAAVRLAGPVFGSLGISEKMQELYKVLGQMCDEAEDGSFPPKLVVRAEVEPKPEG